MKRWKQINAYNIDWKREILTYRNVGKDFNQPKKKRKIKKYIPLDTYSDWKANVLDILPKNKKDRDNICHFLHAWQSESENIKELIGLILVPVYMGLFTVYWTLLSKKISLLYLLPASFILLFIITYTVSKAYKEAIQERNFYKELIGIIDEIKEEGL